MGTMRFITIIANTRSWTARTVVSALLGAALVATAGCKEPNLKPNEIQGSGAPGDSVGNLGPCNAANAGKAQCVDGTVQVCESRGVLRGFQIGRRCFLGGDEVCVEFGNDEAACTRNVPCGTTPQCTPVRQPAPVADAPLVDLTATPRNSAVNCAGTVQSVESCGFSGRCVVNAGAARCQPAAEVFSEGAVCDWYNRRRSRYDIIGTTSLAGALTSTNPAEIAVEDVPMTLTLAGGETRYLRLNASQGVGPRDYVIFVDVADRALNESGALFDSNSVRVTPGGRVNPDCKELVQNQEYPSLVSANPYAIELTNPSATASTRLTVMVSPKDTVVDRVCDREDLVNQVFYQYITRATVEELRAAKKTPPAHILTPELVALSVADLKEAADKAGDPPPLPSEEQAAYFSGSYSLSLEVPHVVQVPPVGTGVAEGESYLNFNVDLSSLNEGESATLVVYGAQATQAARIAYRLETEANPLTPTVDVDFVWVQLEAGQGAPAGETLLTPEISVPAVNTNDRCADRLPDANTKAFQIIKDVQDDTNPANPKARRVRRPYVLVFNNASGQVQTVRLVLIRNPA